MDSPAAASSMPVLSQDVLEEIVPLVEHLRTLSTLMLVSSSLACMIPAYITKLTLLSMNFSHLDTVLPLFVSVEELLLEHSDVCTLPEVPPTFLFNTYATSKKSPFQCIEISNFVLALKAMKILELLVISHVEHPGQLSIEWHHGWSKTNLSIGYKLHSQQEAAFALFAMRILDRLCSITFAICCSSLLSLDEILEICGDLHLFQCHVEVFRFDSLRTGEMCMFYEDEVIPTHSSYEIYTGQVLQPSTLRDNFETFWDSKLLSPEHGWLVYGCTIAQLLG
ncbi:hypothetical protein CPB84DRAFT_1753205 [Gymnopilus junonius]|uniref:Uncharacterized protein n=1 Tax=Gymnopilus junonius TaxID=109634 RepID=A0A9P5N9X7_GYMJU|nr:hypothetical protein CPB84DRAFT_1753205 [Gymnopilus junonius]